MKRLALTIVVLVATACGGRSRASQPTTIEQPRPPSGSIHTQNQAEELYKSERFAEAAWVFEQMVSGRLRADISVERAEFWLAKSFFQLDDYARSLAVFRKIAGNSSHEYYDLALPWLVTLSKHIRDPAIEAVSWYPVEVIDNEAFDDIRDELHYVFGAWYAQRGNFEIGERLLREVPDWSDYHSAARFELGELLWRSGRELDALPYYREVVERWAAEREAAKPRQRKQPPPEHVAAAIERLRSRGFPVGPHGEL